MASWYVFEPPGSTPGTPAAADKAVFVKDGFSWGAFLVAPFWLLWRRMWLVLLAWLAVNLALLVAASAIAAPDGIESLLRLLVELAFALEANVLRAWTLGRKGWRLAGIACGTDQEEAAYRYIGGVTSAPPATVRAPGAQAPRGSWGRSAEPVLGVFPEPFGGRS